MSLSKSATPYRSYAFHVISSDVSVARRRISICVAQFLCSNLCASFAALPELAIRGQQWSPNDFSLHKSIGKSRFGSVHLATNRRSGEQVRALTAFILYKRRDQNQLFFSLISNICHFIRVSSVVYYTILRFIGFFSFYLVNTPTRLRDCVPFFG